MILHDLPLEKALFVTAFKGTIKQRTQCLANLTAYDFWQKPFKKVWRRYLLILEQQGRMPGWDELLADTAIPESVRRDVRRTNATPVSENTDLSALIQSAKRFSQLRKVWDVLQEANNQLHEENIEVEELFTNINDGILLARGLKSNTGDELSHMGMSTKGGKRGLSYMVEFLKGNVLTKIPTGFDAYDKENGGIYLGSLSLFGGPTGSGKSIFMGQLAANMAMSGKRVALVSLEMNEEEVYPRYVANITGQSLTELGILEGNRRIPTGKRKQLAHMVADWDRELAKRGGLLSVYCPKNDVDAMELIFNLAPYKYDVICVDYIGLLRGLDSEDQWRRMSSACRFLKRHAANNKCICMIAVQVNDEGKVRYSQGMVEHSDIAWLWGNDKEGDADNTGQMHIVQLKARNSKQYDFFLHRNSDIMRIGDDANRLVADWRYFYKLKAMTAKDLNAQRSIVIQNGDPIDRTENPELTNEDLGLNDLEEEELIEKDDEETDDKEESRKETRPPKTGLKRGWSEARKNPPKPLGRRSVLSKGKHICI